MALGVMAARPGELELQPEVTLLAQASYLLHR